MGIVASWQLAGCSCQRGRAAICRNMILCWFSLFDAPGFRAVPHYLPLRWRRRTGELAQLALHDTLTVCKPGA